MRDVRAGEVWSREPGMNAWNMKRLAKRHASHCLLVTTAHLSYRSDRMARRPGPKRRGLGGLGQVEVTLGRLVRACGEGHVAGDPTSERMPSKPWSRVSLPSLGRSSAANNAAVWAADVMPRT